MAAEAFRASESFSTPATPPSARTARRRRDHDHHDRVRRLRDLLRSQILHGQYATKLPGEAELMTRYRMPRGVVREALTLLRQEGLIDRLQGYGTYVLHQPPVEDLTEIHGRPAGTGFWQLVSHTSVLARRPVPTPDAVAALMPDAPDRLLQLDYLTHAGDEITGVATNYFRYPEAAALEQTPIGTNFYDFLDRSGVAIHACAFSIGAVAADLNLAQTLQISPGTPLLTLEQRIFDAAGAVVDVAFIWLRADRVILSSFAETPQF